MNLSSLKLPKVLSRGALAPSSEELEGFKAAQRLAYRCAVEIGQELKEGWTEKQTASLMDTYLCDHGVKNFFHRSFAWFGDRTRFQGFKKYSDFMSSNRRLKASDVVILDTAPVVEGFAGDIGYTLSLEENEELDKAMERLRRFRSDIPELFRSSMSTRQIWEKVDRDMMVSGYDNIHSLYPFAVLGHRLYRLPSWSVPGVSALGPFGAFGASTYWAILSHGIVGELLGPKHRGEKTGVWAIEPHLGGKGFGAKFEELLVVNGDKVYWLDDDVPHMKAKEPR